MLDIDGSSVADPDSGLVGTSITPFDVAALRALVASRRWRAALLSPPPPPLGAFLTPPLQALSS